MHSLCQSTNVMTTTTMIVVAVLMLFVATAATAEPNNLAVPSTGNSASTFCPAQVLITPCRCYQRGGDIQVWCSHSDLPRVLAGLRALAKTTRNHPIDELILENNQLPSLPARFFAPLQILRLMLRHNGIERVSAGWLSDLAPHLQEIYVVERQLRNVPADSLLDLHRLEALTIESEHLKRVPRVASLPRLKYVRIESSSLIELPPGAFRDLPALETIYLTGSPHLNRLEAGVFDTLPRLQLLNLQRNGISYVHGKALQRLPQLAALDLSSNAISDARMIGRAVRPLASLERLLLSHNHITALAADSFADMPQLQELQLQANRIGELQAGAFAGTPRLRVLYLEENFVRRCHPAAFIRGAGNSVEYVHLRANEIEHSGELRSLLDGLPALRFLDVSANRVQTLAADALLGHGQLEQLYLDDNRIELIERGAFGRMPSLRELRLRNNSLSNEQLAFPIWQLPGLKGLDLSDNRLARLDARMLVGLPALRNLDVSGNRLAVVSAAAFEGTPLVETINLSHNKLTTLHQATLQKLDKLFEVDASHNELREFVPGLPRAVERVSLAFNRIGQLPLATGKVMNLPNLKWLDLAGNELYRVPRMSMQYLAKLRFLGLAGNRLQTLDELSLVGLKELEQLEVQDNKLMAMHENALDALKQLRVLNLKGNRLELLADRVLGSAEQLRHLDVSENNIIEIAAQVFAAARQLEFIDLSNNQLKELPVSLTGLTELRTLDISNNQLGTIAVDMFSSFTRLEELRVANNRVRALQKGALRGLPHLEYLDLSSNELTRLETNAIRNLPQLKELVLADNLLEELGDRVCEDLPNLQAVHLQHNKLRHIAATTFYRTPSIVYLNVSLNQFTSLQDIGIAGLRNTEVLDASGNRLRRLSASDLAGLDWLVELKLDDNRICGVHGEPFATMPRLRVLTMRNNRIARVAETAFRGVRSNLGVFDLDGNPLRCTCEMLWLRAWYQETNSLTRWPGPRCSDGSMLRDMPRVQAADCQQQQQQQQQLHQHHSNAIPQLTNEHGDSYLHLASTSLADAEWQNECEQAAVAEESEAAAAEISTNGLDSPPAGDEGKFFNDRYIDYAANESSLEVIPTPFSSNNASQLHSLLNLNNTLLNYNKHKLEQQYLQQQQQQSNSKFTFFGMPLPSISMGNLWNFGRDAKTRSVAGTRGTPRLQVYKPEELDFYTFLNRHPAAATENETASRAKILHTGSAAAASTTSGNRTPHYFNNGEVMGQQTHQQQHQQPPSIHPPHVDIADLYQHIYRPPFRTAFAEPVAVERGGFRPILPGVEGNFRPMLAAPNAIGVGVEVEAEDEEAENLAPANSDRVLSGHTSAEVGADGRPPLGEVISSIEHGTPANAEQATMRYDIVVQHAESGENGGGNRMKKQRLQTTTMASTTTSLDQELLSDDDYFSSSDGDKQAVGTAPENTVETTVKVQPMTSSTTAFTTAFTTPSTTSTPTTPMPTTTPIPITTYRHSTSTAKYDPWTTRPQAGSSALGALVAPGAQLSNYRAPPGRSTVEKVTQTPQQTQPVNTASEFQHQQLQQSGGGGSAPLAQASSATASNNAPVAFQTTSQRSATSASKGGKDMSWYYRNYNQTVADVGVGDRFVDREQARPSNWIRPAHSAAAPASRSPFAGQMLLFSLTAVAVLVSAM